MLHYGKAKLHGDIPVRPPQTPCSDHPALRAPLLTQEGKKLPLRLVRAQKEESPFRKVALFSDYDGGMGCYL